MLVPWLWVAPLLAVAAADPGSSLRGAVEALQRRQRSHRGPVIPAPDYDTLYEFIPPGYPDPDYTVDIEDVEDEPSPKYIVKLLEENDRNPETYDYKIIKKKNSRLEPGPRKESAFRERSHHSDNDRLRDLFAERNEVEEDRKNEILQEKAANDAEYALLLGQLWSKYRSNKEQQQHQRENTENAPQGVVKLYKEKVVKKRYPDNWGPIAFKRKRSSDPDNRPIPSDFESERKAAGTPDANYNSYDVSDEDKDDWREEYAIAFQPLDDESLTDLTDDDQYSYEPVEKRFPVTKRSSGPYDFNNQKKRFAQSQKHEKSKSFRSSAGTDPRIIKDLSKIFGDMYIKNPVKRSADNEENHEGKPPKVTALTHNSTLGHDNSTKYDEDSHEHHGHNLHHPGISGKETEPTHDHDHTHDHAHAHAHAHDHDHAHQEKPKVIRKKSIDWSDYFGIDKRSKKFVNDVNQDRLRKQYFDTFNKEVISPVNSFRKHNFVKRNYVEPKPNEETEIQIEQAHIETSHNDDKRDTAKENDSKLDNIDKKLRNMEGMLVDDALRYSEVDEELDSKEEQEMKEKLLSRLAAAYSLEKMRKALKEFKQSLQTQRTDSSSSTAMTTADEAKAKRVAVKKEKVELMNNEIPTYKGDTSDDFEEEQGAGQYLNGKNEQQFSEGYMGGSGRHRTPVVSTGGATGSCPVLAKIVQRCRNVDLLAGDRGQLFLPLCSLHQICYICGDAPPTTCDLVFLSEADTTCEGDMGCQRAARSALMALRELHDNLADEMDGECEASPCLSATLKLNIPWQRALQR
ncbi:uncharacterized protein LOC126378111 isoform X2 [Pectinophora gossypiella]|uniref:uncharacterized protein LOC126378111 isoform X2 n=1 Tax=Pectinophora gossypiella TaxID=13191 RepID=UPI00214E9058|nr:uncharacterized protein LOC126378111 isoform X2 [Pectinophora gossypiella]